MASENCLLAFSSGIATKSSAGPRREGRKSNLHDTLPPSVPMNRRKRLFHMSRRLSQKQNGDSEVNRNRRFSLTLT
jgi:hypothetical protein